MFCQNCGAKIPDGSKFCESCGKPIVGGAPVSHGKVKKKKSLVLAILLVLTLAMTGVTVWYFTSQQSLGEVVNSALKGGGDSGEQIAASGEAEETAEDKAGDEAASKTDEEKGGEAKATDEGKPAEASEKTDDTKASDDAKLKEAQEKVESEFDTVSTTSKTPSNVAKMGNREKLQSGEVVCTLSDGSDARNIWVQDENEKLFFFGYDGCLVKNNYAPDGFYAGEDGSLDGSVSRITGSQGDILMDKEFVTSTSNDPLILFEKDADNKYECLFIKRYSFGYDEVYGVVADPDSSHAYLLNPGAGTLGKFDETKGALLTILDDGATLIVSDCGITETYHVK